MNLNFRKTALLVGVCSVFGMSYSTQLMANTSYTIEAVQQMKKITGTVTDAYGEPIIGANVVEKGTTNGAITDLDGKFTINAQPGSTIVVTYIGYTPQEVTIGNQSNVNIVLQEDARSLEEVVVVGYGVQKKKLLTGATVQVKGDDIAKLNTTNVLTAMQSQSPGVQIVQSTGQPGGSYKVNIRGLGTIGNSAPLYVIDGVAGGDINSINPTDIESIDVLKDAASAAIYGARAANGVILVTTKQGKMGKIQLSYDGYVGQQFMAKMPDVLDGNEYMFARDMISFNEGAPMTDWAALLPARLYDSLKDGSWKGTNWVKESYNKGAITQNHAINMIGGSEFSRFSAGFAYTNQKGIFGGNDAQSTYDRFNVRINSDHTVYKYNDRDVVTIGENLTFSHTANNGIATGNLYWNNMHDLLIGNPLLPAYNSNGGYYTNADKVADGWNVDGMTANPLAKPAQTSQGINESKNYNVNMSAYLRIEPIKDLIFRSQFGYRLGTSSWRGYDQIANNGASAVVQESVSQSMNIWSSWSLENVLTYNLNIKKHHANFVVGQSIEKNAFGTGLDVSSKNTLFENSFDNAYIGNTKPSSLTDITINGWPSGDSSLASFFGRASYNWNETYLAQFTMRADGSSNFARGKRWGYFPSASVGWVMTNENWMENSRSWLEFLKFRVSWGRNGNCAVNNFQYLTTFAFDESSGYFFGVDNKTALTTGGYANILKNPNLTWETSEQLNIGIDARFLDGRLSLNADYYDKKTKDWLIKAPILGVYGLNAPYVNGGDVKNQGFEAALGWNDRKGDFFYNVTANVAYNKNKITKIANTEGIIHGPESVYMQGTTEIYRAEVGKPIGYFWGMKTAGIFQNQEQINAWSAKYKDEIHGKPVPGDIIYVDTNGDGIINADDKTMIGNPHPDVRVGFTISLGYKGFDFSVTGAGAFGHQIVRSTNSGNSNSENLNKKLLYKSWAGEGTSNELPRLTYLSNINWKTFSDIWLEDADYMKIQNVTIGYNFKQILPRVPFTQMRLYFTAQNLFTFTKYTGMDPEVGASGDDNYSWGSGIDLGFYPSPRTYIFGVNLTF